MNSTLDKLTPAARTALAFTHFGGWYPNGIHHATWSAVSRLTTLVPDDCKFVLKDPDATLPVIEKTRLAKAVRLFESHGFVVHGTSKLGRGSRLDLLRESDGTLVHVDKGGECATVHRDDEIGERCRAYTFVGLKMLKGDEPLPTEITDAPAALTADEADLLTLCTEDGEAVARAARVVLADDPENAPTSMQIEIVKRLRGLKARGLPGLIRVFNATKYGRRESIVPTVEGHRAVVFRAYVRGDEPTVHAAFYPTARGYMAELLDERTR